MTTGKPFTKIVVRVTLTDGSKQQIELVDMDEYARNNIIIDMFAEIAVWIVVILVISIIGWFLAFNSGNVILSAVGFFLGGFVMGERPGYGRKETAIGLIIAVATYLLNSGVM